MIKVEGGRVGGDWPGRVIRAERGLGQGVVRRRVGQKTIELSEKKGGKRG